MSNEIPGQVYLCQVSETISCGACCGLYNIPGLSRAQLTSVLYRRTEELSRVPRTEDDLDDFALQELRRIGDDKPYPHFHHCPFLGLIGPEKTRVGCLLHPWVPENRDVDLRGYSYYGAAACRLYFCPSHSRLPARFKRILQVTSSDWYAYGLLITEHRLVSALLADVESRLGWTVSEIDFITNQTAAQHIQPLLRLKEDWPYRSPYSPGPAHYMFEDGEYLRPGTEYPQNGTLQNSAFAPIMDELDSQFKSPESLYQAEAHLEGLLSSLARALS